MKHTISLNKLLGVTRIDLEKAGVFDSTLGIDTKLFIDPKLLVDTNILEFTDSRKKILSYFKELLRIHKLSNNSPRLREVAVKMLAVPEPHGLSIGYGNKSDKGTSIKVDVAKSILFSISEILSVGIEDSEIVEILGLFVKGYGPDSLSDLTVHILYDEFCLYTQRMSKELGVATNEYAINGKIYHLPTYPFSKSYIIFIPYSFLKPLPIATSWKEITLAASHNETLRKEMNKILYPIIEETLIDINKCDDIKKNEFRNIFKSLLNIYNKIQVKSYDLSLDEKGYYAIQPFVETQVNTLSVSRTPRTKEQLIGSIKDLLFQFRRSIEDNGGNKLLYKRSKNGGIEKHKPHKEDVAQIIFYLIADFFCQKSNILLSRESDSGRGPVDFSLGTGYDTKILVEIKKSDNYSLIKGYEKQVEAYKRSENAFYVFYVVIVIREPNIFAKQPSQLTLLKNIVAENKKKGILGPELFIIDGGIKPSPSKLK